MTKNQKGKGREKRAQTSHFRALSIRTGVLLERLGQIEALLHVVVVGGGGVDVPDAAVASLHFTMLLQSLKERERECVFRGFPCGLGFCLRLLEQAVFKQSLRISWLLPQQLPSPTPCTWGHGSTSTGTCTSR